MLLDSSKKTVQQFGIRAFPTILLIDPDGKLVGMSSLDELKAKLGIEEKPAG